MDITQADPTLQRLAPSRAPAPAAPPTRSAPAAVPARPWFERVTILGIPFRALDEVQAVARVRAMLGDGRPHHVVIANAHTVNCACADPAYHAVLCRAALVLRDGVGVEVAGALHGQRLPHNFVGTDFVPRLLSALGPVRVFLYGARPGVAAAAAAALRARAPQLAIAGTQDGYGGADACLAQIRAARPDVLLVALGNPLQERWIDAHLDALGVPVVIGVGALFDFLAGRVPRAPRWLRAVRGEWLFRLACEPRRLWRRYLIGNARFLWRVMRARRGARGGAW